MTYYGSHFLFIPKKYAFTMILIDSQLNSPAWIVLYRPAPLPPSHASYVGSCRAPACCARRLPALGPSLQCSGMQDMMQPACFTLHYKKYICCPANPSNTSEAATTCHGLLVSAPSPLFPHCTRQKKSEQRKLSSALVMIRSALFMIS